MSFFEKLFKNNNSDETGEEIKKPSAVELLYEWTSTLATALICVIIVFIFFFRVVSVVGPSMYPTLTGSDPSKRDDKSGDRLLVYTFMYEPERGDIVIVDRYTDDPLIKRVIAVAGDVIQILPDTCEVVLNNVVLEEPYLNIPEGNKGITSPNEFGVEPRVVPPGHIVVFGDNRTVSLDSRRQEIDFVNVEDVIGKVAFRFAPLNHFGKV